MKLQCIILLHTNFRLFVCRVQLIGALIGRSYFIKFLLLIKRLKKENPQQFFLFFENRF